MKKSIVLLLLSLGFVSCSQNRNLPYDSEAFKQHQIKEKAKAQDQKALLAIEDLSIDFKSDEEFSSEKSKLDQETSDKIKKNLLGNPEVVLALEEMLNNKSDLAAEKYDGYEQTDLIQKTISEKLTNKQAKVDVSTKALVLTGPPKDDQDSIEGIELNIDIEGKRFTYNISELLK